MRAPLPSATWAAPSTMLCRKTSSALAAPQARHQRREGEAGAKLVASCRPTVGEGQHPQHVLARSVPLRSAVHRPPRIARLARTYKHRRGLGYLAHVFVRLHHLLDAGLQGGAGLDSLVRRHGASCRHSRRRLKTWRACVGGSECPAADCRLLTRLLQAEASATWGLQAGAAHFGDVMRNRRRSGAWNALDG